MKIDRIFRTSFSINQTNAYSNCSDSLIMNVTYLCLTLLSYNSMSPFYSLYPSQSTLSFNLQQSLFKNSFATIIYSENSRYYFNIEKTSFHKIMQTAIFIDSEPIIIENQIYKGIKLNINESNKCNHTISNCLFWNCVSETNGGGLFFDLWGNELTLKDSTFISCKNQKGQKHHLNGAGGGGGAYLNCDKGEMKNCCFQDCSGDSNEALYGSAALGLSHTDFTISQIMCYNCFGEKPIEGPVLWFQAYNILDPKHINITGGKSKGCGGLHFEYFSKDITALYVTISNVEGYSIFELSDIGCVYSKGATIPSHDNNTQYKLSEFTFISNVVKSAGDNPCIVAIQLLNGKNFWLILHHFYFYKNDLSDPNKMKLVHLFDKPQDNSVKIYLSYSAFDTSEDMVGDGLIVDMQTITESTSTITIGDFSCMLQPTEQFSNSNYFSISKLFSDSAKFSQSKCFSNSISFSASNRFSNSALFSETTDFSCSSYFSISNGFTNSGKFSTSNYFSGSEKFSASNDFSSSDKFSISLDFSSSDKFTNSGAFSETIQMSRDFTHSSSFSASSTLPPVNINDLGKAKSKLSTGSIIGIIVAILVILLIIILIIIYYKRRMNQEIATQHELAESVPSYEQTNELFNPDADNLDDPFEIDFDEIVKSDPFITAIKSNK